MVDEQEGGNNKSDPEKHGHSGVAEIVHQQEHENGQVTRRLNGGRQNHGFVDDHDHQSMSAPGSPRMSKFSRSRTGSVTSSHLVDVPIDVKTTKDWVGKALDEIDGQKEQEKPNEPPPDYGYRDMELKSTSVLDIALTKTGLVSRIGLFKRALKYIFWLGVHVFMAYAIYRHVYNDLPLEWCDGLGFIIICFLITYAWKGSKLLINLAKQNKTVTTTMIKVTGLIDEKVISKRYGRAGLYLAAYLFIILFLYISSAGVFRRMVSATGLFVLVLVGVLLSKHPKHINWRQVTWGLFLQILLAIFILKFEAGKEILDCLGRKVETFLGYTKFGSVFVYGYLIGREPFLPNLLPEGSIAQNVTMEINEHHAIPAVTVFDALSVIYFFSFMVNILFYYGVVQWVTEIIGAALKWTVGTTPCESVNAAANIFLGQAMAPLLIKPFLHRLTHSEIHTIMAGGFSTIAGLIMAAYISFGVSPAHLLSASFMSAPASLAMAKLLYPETEESQSLEDEVNLKDEKERNLLSEATQGAADAAILVLNITALVIACISTIAFANAMVSFFFGLVGLEFVTFEFILGKVFTPLAFLLGIDIEECEEIGRLIGIKIVVNEFIAYQELGTLIKQGLISERSGTIATYALCGFANPGSIGIQIAALTAMCPERKDAFSRVVMRAFISGLGACFLTACIAGALIDDPGVESVSKGNIMEALAMNASSAVNATVDFS